MGTQQDWLAEGSREFLVLSRARLRILQITEVEGMKGSRLEYSGLMLNLGSRVTSGEGGGDVRLLNEAVGKFSGWRSWLMEVLWVGSSACISERKVLG